MKPSKDSADKMASGGCVARLVSPLPSWFEAQGVSCCSKWGKSEVEHLAWAYVAAQSRDGDTWHEISPQIAYGLLTEYERDAVGGFNREGTLFGGYRDWWAMIGRQLRDADGAFDVGGLAWTRWQFDKANAKEHAPALATPSVETGGDK